MFKSVLSIIPFGYSNVTHKLQGKSESHAGYIVKFIHNAKRRRTQIKIQPTFIYIFQPHVDGEKATER